MSVSSDFLETLATTLKAAGFSAKYDGMYLDVNGCKFDADRVMSRGRRDHEVVKFLESGFKVTEDGSFDVQRAVGLLIKALPERLKEKEAKDRLTANRDALKSEFGRMTTVSEERFKCWYQLNEKVLLGWNPNGFELKLLCDSMDELKAFITLHHKES